MAYASYLGFLSNDAVRLLEQIRDHRPEVSRRIRRMSDATGGCARILVHSHEDAEAVRSAARELGCRIVLDPLGDPPIVDYWVDEECSAHPDPTG
jgi:hypothetical protein